jgi:hypothetical protein
MPDCPTTAELAALRGTQASLARAGRSQAEATAAADAAASERHEALMLALSGLSARIGDCERAITANGVAGKPAADYFAGRARAEGQADADDRGAGQRLGTAVKSTLAVIFGSPAVQTALLAAVVTTLAALGLATGAAGSMQDAWNGTPTDAQEAHPEHP